MSSIFEKKDATSADFVNMQNKLIDDNLLLRKEWEQEAQLVILSYNGNKHPVTHMQRGNNTTSGVVKKAKDCENYVNLIKRQHRVISNYLNNNEPAIVVTGFVPKTKHADEIMTREWISFVMNGQDPRLDAEDDMSFNETTMDETIWFGIMRGIAYTMISWEKGEGYRFHSYDSLDTYIDTECRKLSQMKKFLVTYTKPKTELQSMYPVDGMGDKIDWEEVSTEQTKTKSEIKQSMLVENPKSTTLLVREGYYLEVSGKTLQDRKVYRVRTTNSLLLSKELIPGLHFLPVTWFAPQYEPEKLYPRSWYADMLVLDREVQLLIAKINNIIKTGWRFVYVREGTIISKSTNKLMNSLGIEVLEVSESQELPQQATLLTVSQADLEWLGWLMDQADNEGGMKQDIMGSSSTGPDASGRAIQALQAGSKNNVGTALNELNKYMSRLGRLLMRLHDAYGDASQQFYSEASNSLLTMKKEVLKRVQVKISVVGSDAFDEITKQAGAVQLIELIMQANPDVKISPEVITSIFDPTNDLADKIQADIDAQKNPDLEIADAQNKKLMQGIPMNANQSDDHPTYIALHSELLKSLPPDSPAAQVTLSKLNQHQAFMESSQGAPAGPNAPPPR